MNIQNIKNMISFLNNENQTYTRFVIIDDKIYETWNGTHCEEVSPRKIYTYYQDVKYCQYGSASRVYYTNFLNRRNRRKTKQLIHNEEWDKMSQRTQKVYRERIAWYID